MVKVTKFNNMRGGITEEYLSERKDTLAYVDLLEGGQVGVTVFFPDKGTERRYSPRTEGPARGIVERHLIRGGYAETDGTLVFEWFDLTD